MQYDEQGTYLQEAIDIACRKHKIEALFKQFGVVQLKLPTNLCWAFNGCYFRLDTLIFRRGLSL